MTDREKRPNGYGKAYEEAQAAIVAGAVTLGDADPGIIQAQAMLAIADALHKIREAIQYG